MSDSESQAVCHAPGFVWAKLGMGRVGYGPSLYGPSWLWAEFVMGRVCYGPRCPVTLEGSKTFRSSLFSIIFTSYKGEPSSLSTTLVELNIIESI